jgi:hypothetical protein
MGKRRRPNKTGKNVTWPKKDNLKDAVEIIWRFQSMCRHQLDLGYWVTMDFPTKHHINKILSLQYMDLEVIKQVYGEKLVQRAMSLIPACRHFVAFTKEYNYDGLEQEKQNKAG